MSSRSLSLSLYPFLLVLFIGTTCSSMIGPFMAYYIVEGLGRAPWTISLYAAGVTVLGIICTRQRRLNLNRTSDGSGGRLYVACGSVISRQTAIASVRSVR
ncbi:hypothetical protein RvVAT039_pl03600 (plasmid) [Agrobacterium vitis]|nr:hypothetical protein RvVAT039_pl03600 [Agrobacterium vitis]